MRRNSLIYMICFTLAAALAVTFVTAAGTAVLAGHCGKITADDPFSIVGAVLEKRAADRGGAEESESSGEESSADGKPTVRVGTDMQAAAEISDDGAKDARLAALTAKTALVMLCVITVVVTAVFVVRGRKK